MPGPIAEASDEIADRRPSYPSTTAGFDHHISQPTFPRIAHLGFQDRGKFLRRHPAPREHPGALDSRRGRHHQCYITFPPAAFFKQQRNIQDKHSLRLMPGHEAPLRQSDQRMQDALQITKRGRIAEHRSTKLDAIKASWTRGPRKAQLNGGQRLSARPLQ